MEKVLVVDDSPLVRESLRMCLERSGIEVLEAEDGQVGMQIIERERGRLAACFVDFNMPGMDGIAMVRKARSSGFDGPMLLLTTESKRSLRDEAKRAGATGWLTKPIEAEDLLSIVRHLLLRSA